MPAENTFVVDKGEDIQIDFTIRATDSDTGTALDITGWSFSFKLKRRDSDADPSLVSATITTPDPTHGVVRVSIAAASLLTLEGDYRHSLWRTNAGYKRCLSRGPFSVVDSAEN